VEDLLAVVRGIPGVQYAGVSDFRPLDGLMHLIVRKDSETAAPLAFTAEAIAGDYFAAMGTPLLRGRLFTPEDGRSAQRVAVINAAAASRYWPGEDPLGRAVVLAGKDRGVAQIVGVVGDVRRRGIDRPPDPTVYVPRSQTWFASRLDFVIRPLAGRAAAALAPAVRARMAAVHRSFSADSVTTIEAVMGEQLARPRFSATVLTIFGFLALGLTVTGIYGVTAYSVRTRRYEIGIRIALGADNRHVLGFVLSRSGRALALGLVLGLVGAVAATRVLTRLLYEVKPRDVPTFLAVALILGVSGMVASYIPACRAAKVDPIESVRCD
jgi:putative ABC transport system permease protein